MHPSDPVTRRTIIKAGVALIASTAAPAFAYPRQNYRSVEAIRSLHLHNIHTGESIKTVYWEKGSYNTEAIKDIAYILRDYRTNDMYDIEPRLLDVISHMHRLLGSHKPYEVISGYRSPRTNEMLYEHSKGVNPNSLHMYGKAIDVRLNDRGLSSLRHTAMAMRQGGVGYYPASGFVHIDVGPVKHW